MWPNWNNGGHDIILLEGRVEFGDSDKFIENVQKIQNKGSAIVELRSNGGNAVAALDIAEVVRRTGMITYVAPGYTCASACALIWIAGKERRADKNSCIGFHAIYDPNTGLPSSALNAIAGAQLGYLGLGLDAVYWMLSPPDLDMHWLTSEIANKLNIIWTKTPDDQPQTCGLIARAPPEPPRASKVTLRAKYNLNLRASPDLRSPNLLSPWAPDDYIPAGTSFTWSGDPSCQTNSENAVWCRVTYEHNGTKTTGWISARYLERMQ